ncbi:NADH:flavin oxidoreductase, Old Yellow Enzyme family [Methanosarcina siciliae HI350]|uniref:NADH:flavin oxidoreductase, Old Yellow Enzyme family n=1 Tax=Methanosarcina siciliae HI350 TaxID=1434119 RepID=A0A0E3PHW5_9EURY|nr:alkene reductase [Methanosarcina siciliae]AKB33684.1 NADH:flavin oxidoreductase, Old Yellow Enzyme family [Methanosarcina siciliae HI350]
MIIMAEDTDLFSQYRMGDLTLPNRMVMAPMTRSRAGDDDVPVPLTATYYVQRASAGMIITEGSQVSPQGVGFMHTPGIHSAAQVVGWKEITDAVHKAGGKIFIQLWHVGRVSHPDLLGGTLPVAPSALPVEGFIHTPGGKKPIPVPRALETDEVPDIIRQFRQAAENTKTAGFDGVEIHGANTYLLDQFLRSGSNKRTDKYGGSLENRARLPLEVTKAVIEVWGGDRVGYRISPHNTAHSMSDANPRETFSYFTRELNKTGLGYLHLIEPIGGRSGFVPPEARLGPTLRRTFERTFILNGGYGLQSGNEAIASGEADLIAFGVPFLSNPDLPERFMQNAPLNEPEEATFYVGGEKGYTDYPALVDR